jgi:lysozyme family protein
MDPPEPANIEHLDEILEEYKNLNEKCEKVINKIKTRKASKKTK